MDFEEEDMRTYKPANKISRTGVYKYVNGQLMEAEHEPRQESDYTNWDAGNADPED